MKDLAKRHIIKRAGGIHKLINIIYARMICLIFDLRSSHMTWKVLKLVAVIMSLIGIVWFVGGQHGFVLGALLFFAGIWLFIVCRIFEPKIVIII